MAVRELNHDLEPAKQAIADSKIGSPQLKQQLINFMKKRWNGTFALIGKVLSKKP